MTTPDPISEFDLHAYVDDQLDMPRRIEVEGYLAAHPEAAAQVMADLRTRDTLRLTLGASLPDPAAMTLGVASRLQRGLIAARLGWRFRPVAAAVALVAAGWFLHAQVGPLGVSESVASSPPPAYAEDAVRSHRTALLRARMRSQIEVPDYDAEEIRLATGIVTPDLPRGWQVLDVQVFPSRHGPSVEMSVRTAYLGTLSLFAVRTEHAHHAAPIVVQIGEERVAYWRAGHLAYALTGAAAFDELEQAARALAGSLG
ncbi:anti-sigma factor family protein [Falsiroseomonas sp. E2-1-a20]|uniref:anti-sigma factor family protein n=1 Tax=Falsiroseomonas sp. E2-1-a20 TaxID=3239300 RepID=UPI003F381A55